ncbi:hypothetical protein ADIMK_2744 [Marinobacterium lacunae]|uniref:YjiS-like domain-containing protein n=1 Tax=Marinobacterium lacunae TaxID=1232683 RepID=A0A081FXG5_9GAMM|nr:DUF1127 domain-containing protein [Marinobacterium lacunae]KEA63220.1 hypothetical protein ADIMK_2744 [Marinobacterium lacunae]
MFFTQLIRSAYRRLRQLQQQQRQRKQLLALESHMLKDLGLSKADAAREGNKRFWQS